MQTALLQLARTLFFTRDIVKQELQSPMRLRHPELWRRGFTSAKYAEYRLDENDASLYLPDGAMLLVHGVTGKRFKPILNNKLVFHEVLSRAFEEYLPRLFGVIYKGRFIERVDQPGRTAGTKSIVDLLDSQPALVLKPIDGIGGERGRVGGKTPEGLVHNGQGTDPKALGSCQASLDGYLVSQFLFQHPYAAEIFPHASNTVRTATVQDVATGDPFIFAAIHRFGTAKSGPVDNMAAGGLHAQVDLETGTMGAAAWTQPDGALVEAARHPDTGATIEGTVVPFWDEVKRLTLDLASTYPYLPYVGWDILVTEQGPRIIEGNHDQSIKLIQVHQPLLADPRVRAFYAAHGFFDKPVAKRVLARFKSR